MSAKIIKCTTTDGRAIEFVDEVIASGAMPAPIESLSADEVAGINEILRGVGLL